MKRLVVLFICLLQTYIYADILDPVKDWQSIAHFPAGTVIYKWEADINNDGKKTVFLTTAEDYNNQGGDVGKYREHQMPGWFVYLQNADKSYTKLKGIEEGTRSDVSISLPQIEPTWMYMGFIPQLGKRGIVIMQVDHPRDNSSVVYIRAYTLDGDYFKRVLLTQYVLSKKKNPIYEQFFSDSKRANVKVEKLTLP